MAPWKKDFIETIIDYSFRYAMLFGLTTHLYDRSRRKLVYSAKTFCYSIALHVTQVLLVPSIAIMARNHRYEEKTTRNFLNQLLLLVVSFSFLVFAVSIGSQWTIRMKASKLFNKIIQMWHKDMAKFQSSAKISRAAGKLFFFRTISTLAKIVCTSVATFGNLDDSLPSLFCAFYVCTIVNIIVAVQHQFSLGMIFGEYIFRSLNYNLVRVVKDINGLCDIHSTRYVHRLSKELLEIGRIHTKLQKWVVSFKNLYQLELLFILTSFFVSQVCVLFLLLLVMRNAPLNYDLSQFLLVFVNTIVCSVDMLILFYICGGLIDSCNAAGRIIKDLTPQRLPSKGLERAIEMTCFELMREKIRLSICGLADLDGMTGFAMMEGAVMYIILLVQIDYDNF